MRNILLGVSLAIFNAIIIYLGVMTFFALEISPIPYQFLLLTVSIFFLGARFIGNSIFYPTLITHIFLLLISTYLMANNLFMWPNEFSEPFLTTLSKRYLHLLFEISAVVAALLLGILSKKYGNG